MYKSKKPYKSREGSAAQRVKNSCGRQRKQVHSLDRIPRGEGLQFFVAELKQRFEMVSDFCFSFQRSGAGDGFRFLKKTYRLGLGGCVLLIITQRQPTNAAGCLHCSASR